MKVFLTGGSGFLGSHCAQALRESGHEVFALVRPTSRREILDDLGVNFVEGDIASPATYSTVLGQVDAVMHVAGIVAATRADDFDRINARATRVLAETTLQQNPDIQRFVFVSSIAAAGPSPGAMPRPSDLAENPVTAYGRSKLHAEKLLKELAERLPLVILRPTIIYGERDYEFLKLIQLASKTGFLPAPNTHQVLTYVYVKDVARALVQALTATLPMPVTCHVEDGQTYTVQQTARIFSDVLGMKIRPLRIPKSVFLTYCALSDLKAKLTGRPAIMGMDKAHEALQDYWIGGTRVLREVLHYQPRVLLQQGLERQVQWAKQEGLL